MENHQRVVRFLKYLVNCAMILSSTHTVYPLTNSCLIQFHGFPANVHCMSSSSSPFDHCRYSTVIVNPMIRRSCSSALPPFKVFWSSPFNLVVRNETVTSCNSLSKSCTVGLKNESAFRGELLKFPSITLGQSAENKYQVSSVLHAWRGLVCRSYKIGLLACWTFETTELKWALEKKIHIIYQHSIVISVRHGDGEQPLSSKRQCTK